MAAPPSDLPSNVHVSTHPCVKSFVSQLRSLDSDARQVKFLIDRIGTIVAAEALGNTLQSVTIGTATSPLGDSYEVQGISPSKISLVPVWRSGAALESCVANLLPFPTAVNHLGVFRNRAQDAVVEYYNNFSNASEVPELSIILDVAISTGATCLSAVESLREWGVQRIIVIAVLAAEEGLRKVAQCEDVTIYCGEVDPNTDEQGMIRPGAGDIGDRLFMTLGK